MFESLSQPDPALIFSLSIPFVVWFLYEIGSSCVLFFSLKKNLNELNIVVNRSDEDKDFSNETLVGVRVHSLLKIPRNQTIFDILYLGRWSALVLCVFLIATIFAALIVFFQNSTVLFVYVTPIIIALGVNHARGTALEDLKRLPDI